MRKAVFLVFIKVKSKQWTMKCAKYYLRTQGIDNYLQQQFVLNRYNA